MQAASRAIILISGEKCNFIFLPVILLTYIHIYQERRMNVLVIFTFLKLTIFIIKICSRSNLSLWTFKIDVRHTKLKYSDLKDSHYRYAYMYKCFF